MKRKAVKYDWVKKINNPACAYSISLKININYAIILKSLKESNKREKIRNTVVSRNSRVNLTDFCWNGLLLRGEKILEQLSRTRFFPGFEISRCFLSAKQVGKRAGNFKTRKKSWF